MPPPAAAAPIFDPKRCAIYEVPQSICGNYDETCDVGSLRERSEIWRNWLANKYSAKGRVFDPTTTEQWKERQQARWPGIDTSRAAVEAGLPQRSSELTQVCSS